MLQTNIILPAHKGGSAPEWTEAEESILREYHKKHGKLDVLKCAAGLPGRTISAIRQHARKLGLCGESIAKPWSSSEKKSLITECRREYRQSKRDRRAFDWSRVQKKFPGRSIRGLAQVWKNMRDLFSIAGSQETLSGTIERGRNDDAIVKNASQHAEASVEPQMSQEDMHDITELLSQMQNELPTIDDAAVLAVASAPDAAEEDNDQDEQREDDNDELNNTAEIHTQLDERSLEPIKSGSSDRRPFTQLQSSSSSSILLERSDTIPIISRDPSTQEDSNPRRDSDDFLPDKIRLVQSPSRPNSTSNLNMANATTAPLLTQQQQPQTQIMTPSMATQHKRTHWTAEDEKMLLEAVNEATKQGLKGDAKWQAVASKIGRTVSASRARHSQLKNSDTPRKVKRKSFDGRQDDDAPATKKVATDLSSSALATKSTPAPRKFSAIIHLETQGQGSSFEPQTQKSKARQVIARTPQQFSDEIINIWNNDFNTFNTQRQSSDSFCVLFSLLGGAQSWQPVVEMSDADWKRLPTMVHVRILQNKL